MDPILERKDIICSFENSNGERVSITDSLVIHSLKNDEEESSLIFPIKRLDSYSIQRRQLSEFFPNSWKCKKCVFSGCARANWLTGKAD